jgi:hypothetical protein
MRLGKKVGWTNGTIGHEKAEVPAVTPQISCLEKKNVSSITGFMNSGADCCAKGGNIYICCGCDPL